MFTGKKKAACAAMLSMAMVAPAGGLRRKRNPRHHLRHAEPARRGERIFQNSGQIRLGPEVLVKGVNGDWASVDVGGQSGYMYAKYLGARARPTPPRMSRRTTAA